MQGDYAAAVREYVEGVACMKVALESEERVSYVLSFLCTRITTCYSDRVETGPDFVPGLPHGISTELRQALISY